MTKELNGLDKACLLKATVEITTAYCAGGGEIPPDEAIRKCYQALKDLAEKEGITAIGGVFSDILKSHLAK